MFAKMRYPLAMCLLAVSLSACTTPEEKAANYVENGDELLAEGSMKKAEIEYRNALQINQNLPDALFGLAKIYQNRQEWKEAYAVVSQLRELAPQHVEGRLMLAQLLLASNQLDQALLDAREILELLPDDARAHSLMATVQVRLENHEGALEAARRARDIDNNNNEAILVQARVLINRKNFDTALKLLDSAIRGNPDNAFLYMMKIEALQAMADKDAVEGVFLTLIERFPNNVEYQTALARNYLVDRKFDDAERILGKIVESDPDNLGHKIRLAVFKYQYRSASDAIAQIDSYIAADPEQYPFRFLLGELYERSNETQKAISVYRQIIEDDELRQNGLEARNKIALIELVRGNIEQASMLVDEVLAQDISNKNGLLLRAGLQIAAQEYDEALVGVRTVLRDNPDSHRALGLLGQIYDATGSPELATEAYAKAVRLNPGSAAFANRMAKGMISRGNYAAADDVLLESIASGNRNLETVQLLTQVKLALGQWDEAELLSKELQNAEGQQALSQHFLGILYQAKNDQQASVEAFKRAHDLAPASMQPLAALVKAYLRKGQVSEARRFLESVISDDGDNLNANLLLAHLDLRQGNTADAINRFNRLIGAYPKADAAYHNLAWIYIGQNELDKAEAVIDQGLAALPGLPVLVIDLASVHELKGDFGKAIELYESLLEKYPDLIVARNNLASLLTDFGNDEKTLDRARSLSIELRDSKIPYFRDTYAWALVKSGVNLEEAIVLLEGIVRENEQVDVYHYHLGEAYRKKGDLESAMASLQRAADLAPPGSTVAGQAVESLQILRQ